MDPTGFGSVSGRPPPGTQLVPPQLPHVGSGALLESEIELAQLAQVYEPAGAVLPALRFGIAILSDGGAVAWA